MPLIHAFTILICLAALFSYVNHRLLKLPMTIGLMAVALAFSLTLLALGKLGFGIEAEAQRFIGAVDFSEALMHGMLGGCCSPARCLPNWTNSSISNG